MSDVILGVNVYVSCTSVDLTHMAVRRTSDVHSTPNGGVDVNCCMFISPLISCYFPDYCSILVNKHS